MVRCKTYIPIKEKYREYNNRIVDVVFLTKILDFFEPIFFSILVDKILTEDILSSLDNFSVFRKKGK